jgi:uncharacterized protein YecE (DUF72 family)
MLTFPNIPANYHPYLKIGTCSWKFDSWKGLIYNPSKKYQLGNYLQDYAKYFNTVEIDQWFWSLFPQGAKLPEKETVQIYSDSVPDDFLFTVKVPNSITLTHYYSKQPANLKQYANKPNDHFLDPDLMKRFLDILQPIHQKLGPLIFQFEYLKKTKMPSRKAFYEQLHEFFEEAHKGFGYGIEIRNPNYLKEDFFDFLKEHNLGYVFLDGYYMPSVGDIADQFDTSCSDFTVVRLHGPHRESIENKTNKIWDKVVESKDEGLGSAVSILKNNAERKVTTYVNVNNHYEGCAPLTIERLVKLL